MRRARIIPVLVTNIVLLAVCHPALCEEGPDGTGDPAFSIAEAKQGCTYLKTVECSPKSIAIDGKTINIVSSWLQRDYSESDYQKCQRGTKRCYFVCFTLEPRIPGKLFAFRQDCKPDHQFKGSMIVFNDTGQFKTKPRIAYSFLLTEAEKDSLHITASFKGHSKTTITFSWAK
jgi:hypothetical protein